LAYLKMVFFSDWEVRYSRMICSRVSPKGGRESGERHHVDLRRREAGGIERGLDGRRRDAAPVLYPVDAFLGQREDKVPIHEQRDARAVGYR
jgi:hypothetical protein